ncbi:unnamed protein product, partial [Ectocarpus sp. 12 AP-2014]
FKPKIYRDTKGILTIGYGFNMDRGGSSRNEWNNIFKRALSFDSAKNGEIEITKEQARALKKFGVGLREEELAKIYAPYWDKMRLNERAILTDLYYQQPKLADNNTRFYVNLKEYYRTGNPAYFELAITELKLHSSYSKNLIERIGLQNRNNIRAIILDSRESPLYSNPNNELIPEDKKIKIILGETIIPRELSKKFPKTNNRGRGTLGDYYIWRTHADDKVRPSHAEREGRVFRHDAQMMHPGKDYNCRCYEERLPINAEIIEQKNQIFKENT